MEKQLNKKVAARHREDGQQLIGQRSRSVDDTNPVTRKRAASENSTLTLVPDPLRVHRETPTPQLKGAGMVISDRSSGARFGHGSNGVSPSNGSDTVGIARIEARIMKLEESMLEKMDTLTKLVMASHHPASTHTTDPSQTPTGREGSSAGR
eukprot:COSAG05_NODE_1726_length_4205_cov_2.730151_3_plen_152_part_00